MRTPGASAAPRLAGCRREGCSCDSVGSGRRRSLPPNQPRGCACSWCPCRAAGRRRACCSFRRARPVVPVAGGAAPRRRSVVGTLGERCSSGPTFSCHRAGSHSSTRSIAPTTSDVALQRRRTAAAGPGSPSAPAGRPRAPGCAMPTSAPGSGRSCRLAARSCISSIWRSNSSGVHKRQAAVPVLGQVPAVLERRTELRRQDHPTLAVERVLVRPEEPCHRIELPRRSPRTFGGLLPFTPLCATLAPTPPQVNPHVAPPLPTAPPRPGRGGRARRSRALRRRGARVGAAPETPGRAKHGCRRVRRDGVVDASSVGRNDASCGRAHDAGQRQGERCYAARRSTVRDDVGRSPSARRCSGSDGVATGRVATSASTSWRARRRAASPRRVVERRAAPTSGAGSHDNGAMECRRAPWRVRRCARPTTLRRPRAITSPGPTPAKHTRSDQSVRAAPARGARAERGRTEALERTRPGLAQPPRGRDDVVVPQRVARGAPRRRARPARRGRRARPRRPSSAARRRRRRRSARPASTTRPVWVLPRTTAPGPTTGTARDDAVDRRAGRAATAREGARPIRAPLDRPAAPDGAASRRQGLLAQIRGPLVTCPPAHGQQPHPLAGRRRLACAGPARPRGAGGPPCGCCSGGRRRRRCPRRAGHLGCAACTWSMLSAAEPAVLAVVAVAGEDRTPVDRHRAVVRDPDIAGQPHHRRLGEGTSARSGTIRVGGVDELGLGAEDEQQGPAGGHHARGARRWRSAPALDSFPRHQALPGQHHREATPGWPSSRRVRRRRRAAVRRSAAPPLPHVAAPARERPHVLGVGHGLARPAVGRLHAEPPQRRVGHGTRRPPVPPSRRARRRTWSTATGHNHGRRTTAATATVAASPASAWRLGAGRVTEHRRRRARRLANRRRPAPTSGPRSARPAGTMTADRGERQPGAGVQLLVGGGEERGAEPERHRSGHHGQLDVEQAHHRGHGPAHQQPAPRHDLGRGLGRRPAR